MTDEPQDVNQDEQDREDAVALMMTLVAMDRLAKAEGHSVVEVLVKAAHTAFGINIRPADPVPDETEG